MFRIRIKKAGFALLFLLLAFTSLPLSSSLPVKIDLGLSSAYWDYSPLPGDRRFFPAFTLGLESDFGPLGLLVRFGLGKQDFSLAPDAARTDSGINLTYDAYMPYNWIDSCRMGHKLDLAVDFFTLDFQYRFEAKKAFLDENNSKTFYQGSLLYCTAREQIFRFLSIGQTFGLWRAENTAIVTGPFGDNRYTYGSDIPAAVMNTNNTLLYFSINGTDFPFPSFRFDIIYTRSEKDFKPNYDITVFQQELVWDMQGVDSLFTYYFPNRMRVFGGPGYLQKVSDPNWQKALIHAGMGWVPFSPVDVSFAYLYQRMDLKLYPYDLHSTWVDLILTFSKSLNCILKYRTSLSREGGIDFFANQASAGLAWEIFPFASVNLILTRTVPGFYFQKATWPPDNGIMLEATLHTTVLDTTDETDGAGQEP